uniref:Uncharacterized mitochondrial protein AtMg00810-like n=1 Tax=Tanacetum cinerariifolium TaxID=118510 RepID=A0A6L2JNE1_TANCI|nr:uncharacterized mitochondrial protein AtMg00810-like [Tanacetum cinerariifolium]
MGLWYTKDYGFDLTRFSDVDYVGCRDSFKSTFDGTQFLGKKLELTRLMGKDKAKGLKKKGSRSLKSSSSMNDKALARLMVSSLAMHNERVMEMKKEECLAFLEIRMREVEIRDRELAMQEYKQLQKDIMFYFKPYDHLNGMHVGRWKK